MITVAGQVANRNTYATYRLVQFLMTRLCERRFEDRNIFQRL